MESHSQQRSSASIGRQLSSLKLLSRLLGHELHTQGSSKTITLSREQVAEMQTTIDLFIEDVARRTGQTATLTSGTADTQMVTARNN